MQLSKALLSLGNSARLGVTRCLFPRSILQWFVNENTGGYGKHSSHTTHTGTVQGSVLSPLLFDLFLNALLRLLDSTGITHGIRRIPQWNHAAFTDWNHAAFADDLSIYVCTVKNGNRLPDVVHEFEDWSGLRISTPKSLDTGAMYGTGSEKR